MTKHQNKVLNQDLVGGTKPLEGVQYSINHPLLCVWQEF